MITFGLRCCAYEAQNNETVCVKHRYTVIVWIRHVEEPVFTVDRSTRRPRQLLRTEDRLWFALGIDGSDMAKIGVRNEEPVAIVNCQPDNILEMEQTPVLVQKKTFAILIKDEDRARRSICRVNAPFGI